MGDVVIAEGSRRIGCKRRVNASHVIRGTIYARGMRKSMLYEHNEDITHLYVGVCAMFALFRETLYCDSGFA